jgi:hypothetical protein
LPCLHYRNERRDRNSTNRPRNFGAAPAWKECGRVPYAISAEWPTRRGSAGTDAEAERLFLNYRVPAAWRFYTALDLLLIAAEIRLDIQIIKVPLYQADIICLDQSHIDQDIRVQKRR